MKTKGLIKISQLIFFIVVMLPFAVHAAPSISSTSGTLTHGQTVTVNGSGFGTKSPVAPLIWADFATDINPSSVGLITSWSVIEPKYGGGTLLNQIFSGLPTGAGTSTGVSYTINSADSNGGILAVNPSFRIDRTWTKIYHYQKRYYTYQPGVNSDNNNKFWRLWASAGSSVNFVASYVQNSEVALNETDTTNPDIYQGNIPLANTWNTEEFVWQKDGGSGNYVNGSVASGSGIWDFTRNGVQQHHMESVSNGSYTYDQLRIDNLLCETWPDDGNKIYMTDIYIDETYARVMIGNASTLAASTHREIQIPQTTWTDNGTTAQLQMKVNQGSFPDNSTAYLYVIDSTGAVNSTGYPVTFGYAPLTVSLTAPANGASYTVPATFALTASASSSGGLVGKVEFYNGSTLLGSVTAPPYSYTCSNVPAGTYRLTARAYDNLGGTADSAPVTVTVSDTTLPSISIASPASGAAVSGTVSVAATASDNVAVTRVEFYVSGELLSTVYGTPYSYSWDTTSVANASYTLFARAYDSVGNFGRSSNVGVSVNNSVPACLNLPVYTVGNTTAFYADLQTAYVRAADNDEIRLQGLNLSGDVILDRNIQVSVLGGYDCGFTVDGANTGIFGKLRAINGTVRIDKLCFK